MEALDDKWWDLIGFVSMFLMVRMLVFAPEDGLILCVEKHLICTRVLDYAMEEIVCEGYVVLHVNVWRFKLSIHASTSCFILPGMDVCIPFVHQIYNVF